MLCIKESKILDPCGMREGKERRNLASNTIVQCRMREGKREDLDRIKYSCIYVAREKEKERRNLSSKTIVPCSMREEKGEEESSQLN